MAHNNDNTVLQAGPEDLPGTEGPIGQTGATGPAGTSGINPNILSIECIYSFNPVASYQDSFVKNYVIEQGTRFKANASHVYNTTIAGSGYPVLGELTNFLNTSTDKITAHIQVRKVILHTGSIVSFMPMRIMMQIFEINDDSIKWRVVHSSGNSAFLAFVADPLYLNIKEIHFSLLITAINT